MAAKDLTAIGLEILQTARNELYLNLPIWMWRCAAWTSSPAAG